MSLPPRRHMPTLVNPLDLFGPFYSHLLRDPLPRKLEHGTLPSPPFSFSSLSLSSRPFFYAFHSFFSQRFSEEFFAMLKVSPLAATAICGYFVLFFVTLFPNILPIRSIVGRFFQRFRYRRGHISHMCFDRLRRLIRPQGSPYLHIFRCSNI
jgi:hypothetical protein